MQENCPKFKIILMQEKHGFVVINLDLETKWVEVGNITYVLLRI